MAKKFTELVVGDTFQTPSRTISESDVMCFAGLTGDFNELHISKTFAEQTAFGERIAHGMLTLSMANGMYMRSGIFESSVLLGIDDIRFLAPVKLGDTISLTITIDNLRKTSKGDKLIVEMRYNVQNQEDRQVLGGIFRRMVTL